MEKFFSNEIQDIHKSKCICLVQTYTRNLDRMIHLIPTKHESWRYKYYLFVFRTRGRWGRARWRLPVGGVESSSATPGFLVLKGRGSVWSDERNGRNRPFLKPGTKLDENVLLKMEGADGGQESRNYPEKFKAKRTIKRDLGRGWDYLPSKLNNGTLTFAIFALFSFRLEFSEFFSKKYLTL